MTNMQVGGGRYGGRLKGVACCTGGGGVAVMICNGGGTLCMGYTQPTREGGLSAVCAVGTGGACGGQEAGSDELWQLGHGGFEGEDQGGGQGGKLGWGCSWGGGWGGSWGVCVEGRGGELGCVWCVCLGGGGGSWGGVSGGKGACGGHRDLRRRDWELVHGLRETWGGGGDSVSLVLLDRMEDVFVKGWVTRATAALS
jgi:hypothetical protein